jgi:hypothetical protein
MARIEKKEIKRKENSTKVNDFCKSQRKENFRAFYSSDIS